MKWDFLPKLLAAKFCMELSRDRFKDSLDNGHVQEYSEYTSNLYRQINVELSPFDNTILFAYKGQTILRVPRSRITSDNCIRLSEEETDKANAMIGLIDSFS